MVHCLPANKEAFSETAVGGSLYESKACPDLIEAFEKRAIKVICSEGRVLFRHGESGECVYLVLSGRVGLLLPITPMDGMGFRAQSGSLLGLPAAFNNGPYSMTAIAWKGAELAVMSRDKFCDLIASNAAFSLDVLRILAAETRAARIAIVDVGMSRRGRAQR